MGAARIGQRLRRISSGIGGRIGARLRTAGAQPSTHVAPPVHAAPAPQPASLPSTVAEPSLPALASSPGAPAPSVTVPWPVRAAFTASTGESEYESRPLIAAHALRPPITTTKGPARLRILCQNRARSTSRMQCADGAIVGPPPQLTDSLGEPGETQGATVAMHAIDIPALPLAQNSRVRVRCSTS